MDELLENLTVGETVLVNGFAFRYHGYEIDEDTPGVFSIHLSPVTD